MSSHVKEQNKKAEIDFYDHYSEMIDDDKDEFSDEIYDRLFQMCQLEQNSGKKLLETGCGSGVFGKRLAQRGYQVTGVDLSQKMVDLANTKSVPKFKAIQGDLEDHNLFEKGFYEIIFWGQVLHHFPNIDLVIQNSHQWLKKEGKIVIIEPNGSNPVNRISHFFGKIFMKFGKLGESGRTINERNLSYGEIARSLLQQDFQITHIESLTFPYFLGSSVKLPRFLKVLLNVRELLYLLVWKFLPKKNAGRILTIVAQKS